ncbi:hypothetical protein GS425_16920, partial [Rhodococcus hoagii]|nr:hypothetical protein [Prescottella equi]
DLRASASEAIANGFRTLVISDRDSDHLRAPIPTLLAVSAVHRSPGTAPPGPCDGPRDG